MSASIELSIDEQKGIAFLCINNPEKRNAISGQMMEQLSKAIDELENWKSGKAIIVYGKNGFFSSGADLKWVAKEINSKAMGHYYSGLMVSNLSRLKALPLLSVAVIDGMALGGGAEIAVACDLRIMTRRARIGFVQIKLGLSTAWSGGCRLVQIVGPTKAMDLLLSGRVLSCEEALELGLIHHSFDDPLDSHQFIGNAIQWVQSLINLTNATNDQMIDFKNSLSLSLR